MLKPSPMERSSEQNQDNAPLFYDLNSLLKHWAQTSGAIQHGFIPGRRAALTVRVHFEPVAK